MMDNSGPKISLMVHHIEFILNKIQYNYYKPVVYNISDSNHPVHRTPIICCFKQKSGKAAIC